MIKLTEFAAEHVDRLIAKEGPDTGLRVGVRGGGCSGFTYYLEFASLNSAVDNDKIVTSHGIKLMIDKKSYLYLMGTDIDYIDGLDRSGFKFINPNAKRTCGCGESFSV